MSDEPKRTPIPIARLVVFEPKGIQLPYGPTGDNVQLTSILKSGLAGNIRCEITYRPWMRAFCVVYSNKVERSEKGKTVEAYEPRGKPLFVPESVCAWVPEGEV
jgi:hypothetical protein